VALLEGSELRFEVVGFALREYTRIPILQHPELGGILLVDRAAVRRSVQPAELAARLQRRQARSRAASRA